MDVWERERLEREDLLAQQKANMPIDEWKWLARKQVTPENASLLLVGISPIGYHDLYTHKSPWQEEGIWLIRSLSDEEQLQSMPLIDWYIWADNHPQVRCIDGIARVISPALEAFENILDSAPSASSKDELQLATGVNDELHPRRENTYQHIIAALLAMQYSPRELSEAVNEQPYSLAELVLEDCQKQGMKAPASRNTLGKLFGQLQPVQKAQLD